MENLYSYVVESKGVVNKRESWVIQDKFRGFNEALDYAVEFSKHYIFTKVRVIDERRNNKVVVLIDKK